MNTTIPQEDRSGRITYDEVADICELLKEIGTKITHLTVHTLLGRGSFTTIGKYLRQWEEAENKTTIKLRRSVIRSLEAEMERVSSERCSELSAKNNSLQSEVESLKDKLSAYQEVSLGYEKSIAQLNASCEAEVAALRNQIEAEKIDKDAVLRKLTDARQALEATKAENAVLRRERESATVEAAKQAAINNELRQILTAMNIKGGEG